MFFLGSKCIVLAKVVPFASQGQAGSPGAPCTGEAVSVRGEMSALGSVGEQGCKSTCGQIMPSARRLLQGAMSGTTPQFTA